MKIWTFIVAPLLIFIMLVALFYPQPKTSPSNSFKLAENSQPTNPPHPLNIEFMRQQAYPGSQLKIEQTLSDGTNYHRFIVSYLSDGFKIYALLTTPTSDPPKTGWPVIIFNHGYIPPDQYKTTQKYLAYTDAFAKNGYVVLKSDYRGHGNSEGNPEGGYYSPAYTNDVLNAIGSIKQYPNVDINRIGMWGHSMGGSLTLRTVVVSQDIKAADIWAGVVADYQDMATNWRRPGNNIKPWSPSAAEQAFIRPSRQQLIDNYGDFATNPDFWRSIAPIHHVTDINIPIQIQHGTADDTVPLLFSQKLNQALTEAEKTVIFYTYPGDDHNLSKNLSLALKRSVDFFDKYLKN